jgi:GxxExxY protein
MTEIVYKDLSYKINGICFKVHKDLGRYLKERQYGDKFEELLKIQKLDYFREYELQGLSPDMPGGNRVDFIVEDKIIVELKAKNFITKEDYFQIQRYLTVAHKHLGLIVNFRQSHLKPKRVVNSAFLSNNSSVN